MASEAVKWPLFRVSGKRSIASTSGNGAVPTRRWTSTLVHRRRNKGKRLRRIAKQSVSGAQLVTNAFASTAHDKCLGDLGYFFFLKKNVQFTADFKKTHVSIPFRKKKSAPNTECGV